jgi:diguanylate cyclase (GGDEF)-like protein
MSAVIINYIILAYLDMQIAPDYSAVIAPILFLSVTMWLDTATYAGMMVVINLLIITAFLTGVHESVHGSELFIEMFLFSLIGMGLFYSIGEGRMRTFTNDLLLRDSVKKLRESSLRDPLTGMFNRRMMNEDLEKVLALSLRTGKPVSIILLDLDRFKRINDSLGHTVGDEVLKQTVSLIQGSIRESDSAFRFGGEEFVIMLPDTPLQNALILAERLISRFRSSVFEGVPWTVTASMGIADSTERHLSADLIKLADSRMYRAKETGRDRYVFQEFNEKSEIESILIPE